MLYARSRKLTVDLSSPLEVFEQVRSEHAVLLLSGGDSIARDGGISVIGFDPFMVVEGREGSTRVATRQDLKWREVVVDEEPLDVLQKTFEGFDVDYSECEFSFCGGALGFLSYNYGLRLEGLPQVSIDHTDVPDLYFVWVNRFFVWDHADDSLWAVTLGAHPVECENMLDQVEAIFSEDKREFAQNFSKKLLRPVSNLSKETYAEKISLVHQKLFEGETYEVNFSHQFKGVTGRDPWEMFKELAVTNPSPYACFFQHPDFQMVSCSPERLIVCRDEVLETRPIKGTVPRGKNEEEDKAFEEELLASEKNEAELNMIVDLARNDLGKVSEIGTVEVSEHRVIEKYSHVQHTMSNVRSMKRKDASFSDVVRALFPGGSVTGAPKRRTMEIIDELEECGRGVYCGSAGYLSFNGNFDLNILIRTMLCKDGDVFFNAGGAIVVDSEAEEEWGETFDKAQALINVVK